MAAALTRTPSRLERQTTAEWISPEGEWRGEALCSLVRRRFGEQTTFCTWAWSGRAFGDWRCGEKPQTPSAPRAGETRAAISTDLAEMG